MKWGLRFLNFSFFLMILGLLVIPFFLTPSPTGLGTHQQLGLPPCFFLLLFGIPCPSCGLTTSFAHMAAGNIGQALTSNLMALPIFVGLSILCCLLFLGTFKPQSLDRFFLSHKTRFMVDVGVILWAISWISSLTIDHPVLRSLREAAPLWGGGGG